MKISNIFSNIFSIRGLWITLIAIALYLIDNQIHYSAVLNNVGFKYTDVLFKICGILAFFGKFLNSPLPNVGEEMGFLENLLSLLGYIKKGSTPVISDNVPQSSVIIPVPAPTENVPQPAPIVNPETIQIAIQDGIQ